MLRIVDLEGKQAVDFLCYNAHDHADRYAAADTMKINPAGIFLSTGSVLYSVGLTPLFTIVADTCGKHDTKKLTLATRSFGPMPCFASSRRKLSRQFG